MLHNSFSKDNKIFPDFYLGALYCTWFYQKALYCCIVSDFIQMPCIVPDFIQTPSIVPAFIAFIQAPCTCFYPDARFYPDAL